MHRKLVRDLKKRPPPDLDEVSSALHDEVFSRTNCLTCGNCCKTTSPVFYEKDIERAADHLGLRPSVFAGNYLRKDEDNDWVFHKAPCPFLESDNRCRIYEYRPTACREYPHTKRKRFYQVLDLALKNSFICPAVREILSLLRKTYPANNR